MFKKVKLCLLCAKLITCYTLEIYMFFSSFYIHTVNKRNNKDNNECTRDRYTLLCVCVCVQKKLTMIFFVPSYTDLDRHIIIVEHFF